MSRIRYARHQAEALIVTHLPDLRASGLMADSAWSDLIDLARAIRAGYVTGITAEASTALDNLIVTVIAQTRAARAATTEELCAHVLEGVPLPTPVAPIAFRHQRLVRADGSRVLVGDTIRDGAGDPFVITSAEWNDMIDERTPVLVGYWPSIDQCGADAGGAPISTFPGLRWNWFANA